MITPYVLIVSKAAFSCAFDLFQLGVAKEKLFFIK